MKNNFIIREANAKDLKDILRFNFELCKKEYKEFNKSLNLNWTYAKGKKYFRDKIIKKDSFVGVIENNGKIIGYLCGGIYKGVFWRKKARYAALENMLIMKKFRGKGLGSKLTKDFIDWCKKNKVNYISVTAASQNKSALNFYRNSGFKDYELTLEMILNQK